ncbi:ATP-binding protein [Streptomyces glaucescens]
MGRRREMSLLCAALDSAMAEPAEGSAVLLQGEAGIGKTALLDRLATVARDRGFSVLRATGSEAEAGLSFGAVRQIVGPLTQRSTTLPLHQRQALRSALGPDEEPAPGGFLVGAAVLALIAETTRGRPLLILVDDLHWVDSSSLTVFAFLHRRITDLPLVFVSASRSGSTATDGWPAPSVQVTALARDDAALLLRRHHAEVAGPAVERVLDEAAGNPLVLVELPLQLRPEEMRGAVPLPEGLRLGERLERLFAHRLETLSAEASRILLLVALGGGTAAWNVGRWLDGGGRSQVEEVLDGIEAGELARLDSSGRLVFRHPLVRSAVIARASARQRREAHRVLADALPVHDPRRPVHEAAAALGPDEELAARLQEAGRRMSRRGGDAEAAMLLDRAAAISTDPSARARRLTWAAVMAARGGHLPYAARIISELARQPVPQDVEPLFAYAVVYVDQSHHIDFDSSFALLPKALDALVERPVPGFEGLAEQAFFKLLLASAYTGDARGWTALAKHAPRMSPAARLCRRAWSDPPKTAHGVVGELQTLIAGMSEEQEAGAAWLLLWVAAAVDMADEPMRRRFGEQHAYATQGTVAKAKSYQDFLRGRWDQAEACLREAEASEERGYHCNALLFRLSYACFLAGRGDEPGLLEIEQLIGPVAARAGMTLVTRRLTHLRGLAALAHGRAEEAYARFAEVTPPGTLPPGMPWFHVALFDFVTAAVLTGRQEEAQAHVAAARAAHIADISPHHAFLLAAASAVAADEDADARYQAAYAVPGAERWVFETARLRLAHGRALRRHQSAGARDRLSEAYHAFRSLGAAPWAEQARRELRAAGQPLGGAEGRRGQLTAQELRIAQLAADGLTNREIGDRLDLSPRTVADHLHKIFPKLEITSRAALARALAADGP